MDIILIFPLLHDYLFEYEPWFGDSLFCYAFFKIYVEKKQPFPVMNYIW